jgi:phosphopantothenoylcysteine decarboxylase
MTLASAPAVYAERIPNVVLVPPQAKRLACGDFGLGAMAEVVTIAEVVRHWSERAEA